MSTNVAIILAGGKGNRMGTECPKQFLELRGKTILEYSIHAFEQNPHIDEIAVVVAPEYHHRLEDMKLLNGWTKLTKVLEGGKERSDSSLAAIRAYEGQEVNLLFTTLHVPWLRKPSSTKFVRPYSPRRLSA
ncbi:MAG: 2-C-methyl-D-erythritol 4-phosphate cytidylyltransferase [Prevotellamassilia sp.]